MCRERTIPCRWAQKNRERVLNTSIRLDIPQERIRSLLSSYYMSKLPGAYRPTDHVLFPQQDLKMAQQLLQSDDFDTSGAFQRAEPRHPGEVIFETASGRQRLRRIETNSTWRVRLTRWLVNYFRSMCQFSSAHHSVNPF